MKIQSASYYCFIEKGEDILPDDTFIDNCYEQGIEPIIFLDSCVCLHIINIVDYGKAAKNINFSRILALKEYLEKHPRIKINPIFAFLELCGQKSPLINRNSKTLNYEWIFLNKFH